MAVFGRTLMIVLIALVALASASFEPVRPARAQTPEDSSETLTQLMQRLSSEGMAELRHLTTFYSPRQPYSPEELAAAEYIEEKLKALGDYTLTVQPFRTPGKEDEVSELSLVGLPARDVRSQAMEGSAVGDVTAPVVAVGEALAGDVPDSGLDGKVALIERGSISFAEQVSRVAGAGAVAAIIYNSQDRVFRNGQPFSGSLIEGDHSGSTIPVATIWREEGTSLLDTLNEGTEVRVRLKVAYGRWLTSRNIIAEKVGTDSSAGVVVGAHYDTLRSAQGASDNGTGVASLLVMAEEISGLQLAHTVRFIFFGAEEWGLDGSEFYVEEYSAYEEGAIIAMINLTSLGSGRPAVSSIGSRVLTDWVTGTFASQNSLDVRYWNPPGGPCFSDHCSFSRTLSVPTISFHGDDLSVSNSYDDVIDLVDPSIMGTQMAVALELIRQAPSIVPRPPTPEPKPPAPPSPPFAAPFLGLPERHDGEKDFFFWLTFNQQPDELGRRTVWDGLLHIGGADTTVTLWSRYTIWFVTVEPTQRGDITIRLPRRECTDVGSVCADGRPLSEGLSETVPGPDSRVTSNRNSPATGSPAIEGSPVVGQALTATSTGIADEDGMMGAVFAYRWLADDVEIAGATASTYTLTSREQGKTIRARVSFTDDAGNEESVTSAATEAVTVANSPASGAPSISGTAQVSETLTVDTSGIADADGLTNASFAYRWLADDVEIAGATASTYTLTSSEQGKTIKVRLSFTDDAGNEESVASATTGLVAAAPSPLTATVQDTPGSHDGQNAFTFELHFSEEPRDDFSYRTLRDNAFTVTGGEVVNAQRVNPPSNVGWRITVQPSGDHDVTVSLPATTDCAHWGAVCTVDNRKLSSATELTVPGPVEQQVVNSPATGAPTIRGTVQVGETLTADTSGIADADGLTSATFTYGWLADDVEIAGATGSTYTLAADDEGKAIKAKVTFTDDAGNTESLTSATTTTVAAAPSPLTASVHSTPASHDGSATFTFELQFSETPKTSFSYVTLRDHAFTVTGGEVVKARRLEPGKNIRWEITMQPSGNADVTIVLPVTTDCDAQGAVCTEDGRMLSRGLELTVPGP